MAIEVRGLAPLLQVFDSPLQLLFIAMSWASAL